MGNLVSKLRRWKKSKADQQAEDDMAEGFEDLPSENERRRMSLTRLAVLLSTCEKGTSKYILVEHELNLRIAKIQSRATYVGAITGVVGTLVGAVVGAILTIWIQIPQGKLSTDERGFQPTTSIQAQDKLLTPVETVKPPINKANLQKEKLTGQPSSANPLRKKP